MLRPGSKKTQMRVVGRRKNYDQLAQELHSSRISWLGSVQARSYGRDDVDEGEEKRGRKKQMRFCRRRDTKLSSSRLNVAGVLAGVLCQSGSEKGDDVAGS